MLTELLGDEFRFVLNGRLTAIFHPIPDLLIPTVAELTKFIDAPRVNIALRVQGQHMAAPSGDLSDHGATFLVCQLDFVQSLLIRLLLLAEG